MSPASAASSRPSRSAKRTPAAEALTALVFEVFRLNGRLLALGERLTRDEGLTAARWQALGVIELRGPLTVPQIARQLGLRRQSVQRTVDLLEAEGCVALRANPEHARARLVAMTARGEEKLRRMREKQSRWANRITEGMAAQELEASLAALEALRRRMETEEQE